MFVKVGFYFPYGSPTLYLSFLSFKNHPLTQKGHPLTQTPPTSNCTLIIH